MSELKDIDFEIVSTPVNAYSYPLRLSEVHAFVVCLEDIQNAKGLNAKKDILEEYKDNRFVRWYCECCYDFYKTMGTTTGKINSKAYAKNFPDNIGSTDYYNQLVETREKLCKRELTGGDARRKVIELSTMLPEIWGKHIANAFNRKSPDGLGTGTVNKVYPDLKPARGVQLCRGSKENIHSGMVAEYKIDGLRNYIFWNDNTEQYEVYTRGQRQLNSNNYSYIIDKLVQLGVLDHDHVVDAEISGKDWNESVSLAKTLGDLPDERKAKLCLHVFDRVLKTDYFDNTCIETLAVRRKQLEELFGDNRNQNPVQLIYQCPVNSLDEAWKLAAEFMSVDYYGVIEGAVVKDPNGYYGDSHSKDWIKVKPRETLDFKIVGYQEGAGKIEGMLGALILQLDNGDTVHCGSGYSDEQRKELWAIRDQLIGNYAEVEFLRETKDGSVREPIFQRYRQVGLDK